MKRSIEIIVFLTMVAALTVLIVSPVISQDKPADNMQILREKIRADKKLLVAANMDLTESEAKAFWPVYESYQKELEAIDARLASLIKSYAQEYNSKSLSDEKAKSLTDEMLAIEGAEVNLRKSYASKLRKALPAKKVARYLQIENKIRAVVQYELAAEIPLVE